MKKKDVLTIILAIAGTFMVWFPIMAPIFFSIEHYLRARRFMIDYLMPAELFPAVLLGGALLLWVAFRAQARRGLIGGSLAAAVVLPFIGGALATVTGLASGETAEGGWQSALVFAFIALYNLAVICLGLGGILLIRDLFKPIKNPKVHEES
jgi:hypothetical protein